MPGPPVARVSRGEDTPSATLDKDFGLQGKFEVWSPRGPKLPAQQQLQKRRTGVSAHRDSRAAKLGSDQGVEWRPFSEAKIFGMNKRTFIKLTSAMLAAPVISPLFAWM